MRSITLAFGLAFLISACTKNEVGNGERTTSDSLPSVSYLNLSYGTDNQQKMDVYLPALRSSNATPLMIIIHGGGWTAGDKDDFDSYIAEFQKRFPNYAFANLNYRLATQTGNYFPTQENDVQSAIQFLKDKSSEYQISNNNYVLLGISAGAHLSLLQGYKHSDQMKPKGIISFFGPVDLQKLYLQNLDKNIPVVLRTITNTTLDKNPDLFIESSPINYVNSSSAPTLIMHGDKDKVVPVEQAYQLDEKLTSLGVSHKLVIYPGQGHGFQGADVADSFNQVEEFVKGLGTN